MKKSPPQSVFTTSTGLLVALFLLGCAAPQQSVPDRPTTGLPITKEGMAALSDRASDSPDPSRAARIYHYLNHAFNQLQTNKRDSAAVSLDRATILLADLSSKGGSGLSSRQLSGLVRVTLELNRDLLPPTAPILPESTLHYLLTVLPDSVTSHIRQHPFFAEFWIRKLAGSADVPVDYRPEVLESIRYFLTDGREVFKLWLSRSGVFTPLIQEALLEAELPQDLVYKAMIESGFNPRAYSRAGASGLWQFVAATAPLYGLKRNCWIDERRDPEKSTHAAIRHIKHLYRLFEDWRLVIAAYNCGQGRLSRIIEKSGTRDFWKLKGLPRETRNHVPRFMAALILSKDPEWFGFTDVVYRAPFSYDLVAVSEWIDLSLAADCAGTSFESLKALNPELRAGYTPAPPVRRVYHLRVPAGSKDRFLTNYARVPSNRKVQMVEYRVRHGDTVSGIANQMQVNTRAVMDANAIKNPRRLRVGTRLKIPVRPSRQYSKNRLTLGVSPDKNNHEKHTYNVRRGDTLWGIAKEEGVTPDQIRTWNSLTVPKHIFPGDRLVIWRPKGSDTPLLGNFYLVRSGDTLWEIARDFDTSVRNLKKWNGIRRASSLKAGRRLLVKPLELNEAD
jgi:membrane-bound lytic murein transglycosylase D